jgi:hypothetical protein
MPRTAKTAQATVRASNGLNLTLTAVDQANGNEFLNTNYDIIAVIVNAHTAPITATFVTAETLDADDANLAVADLDVVVPAGETRYVGPFPNIFNQTGNLVYVDWDIGTSVTWGLVQMGDL